MKKNIYFFKVKIPLNQIITFANLYYFGFFLMFKWLNHLNLPIRIWISLNVTLADVRRLYLLISCIVMRVMIGTNIC